MGKEMVRDEDEGAGSYVEGDDGAIFGTELAEVGL